MKQRIAAVTYARRMFRLGQDEYSRALCLSHCFGSQPRHSVAQGLPLASRRQCACVPSGQLTFQRGKGLTDRGRTRAWPRAGCPFSESRWELFGRCHFSKAWTMPISRLTNFVIATSRQLNLVRGFAMRHRSSQFSPRTFHDSPLREDFF